MATNKHRKSEFEEWQERMEIKREILKEIEEGTDELLGTREMLKRSVEKAFHRSRYNKP